MAPRVDLCGRPAAVTVGAPDVTLLDLGEDGLPGQGAPEQIGHVGRLRGAVPVVELQAADVPFAAVDARMRREVRSDPDAERLPVGEVAPGDVAMCSARCLRYHSRQHSRHRDCSPSAAAVRTLNSDNARICLQVLQRFWSSIAGTQAPTLDTILTKTGGPRGARTHADDGLKVRCSTN